MRAHVDDPLCLVEGANTMAGLLEVRQILSADGKFVVIKDDSVSFDAEATAAFLGLVGQAEFVVATQQRLWAEDVSVTLWVFETGN